MKELKIFGKQVFAWGEPEISKVKGRDVGLSLRTTQEYRVGELDQAMLRKIALKAPLFLKGVYKKNRDTVRNWFEIKPADDKNKVDKTDLRIVKEFEKRTNLQNKLFIAGVCANIYGTGFLERTYIEPAGKKPSDPVQKGSEPLNVVLLNPEFIKEIKKKSDKDPIHYYVYREKISSEEIYIHPDRIIPVVIDSLPYSKFGISKVNVLSTILKSKLNTDEMSGQIIDWAGNGILDMTIQNMNDEQEKKMNELYRNKPNGFVHDQDYNLEVINPVAIDPKPFYDYFYTNIAAGLEMPTHILIGQQIGNVTGSEIGVSDYYHDIENIQKIIFTPIIEDIYKELLESHNKRWKYNIDWNPIFVDELSEAKIVQSRTYSVKELVTIGVISEKEGRKMINEGIIYLEPDEIPEKKKPIVPSVDPNVAPQPVDKEPKVKTAVISPVFPLTDAQREMIRKEKLRGEIELIEQEKRIEEAKKKKGKK